MKGGTFVHYTVQNYQKLWKRKVQCKIYEINNIVINSFYLKLAKNFSFSKDAWFRQEKNNCDSNVTEVVGYFFN